MSNTDFTNASPVPGTAGQPAAPTDLSTPQPVSTPEFPSDTPEPEKPYLTGQYGQKAVAARQAGAGWDQINKAFEGKIQAARQAGATEDQINRVMGWGGKTTAASFDALFGQKIIDHFAANPTLPNPAKSSDDNVWDAFLNGLTHSSGAIAGQTALGQADQITVSKQYPDIFRQVAQSLGYMVTGAPLAVSGAMTGAEAGTAAFPGTGTVIGGLIGLGIGIAGDEAVRQAAADRAKNGPAQGVQDLGQRFVGAWYEGAKAALPVVGAAAVGGPVGALAAKAGGGMVLQWGSKIASQIAAMTTISAGINGQLPTGQDFVDTAIGIAAFEVSGGLIRGAAKGAKALKPGEPIPHPTVSAAMSDLLDAYVRNGELPAVVIPRIAVETSIEGLKARADELRIRVTPDVEKAWEVQNIAERSPGVRARWFNSAVTDGPDIAAALLAKTDALLDENGFTNAAKAFNDARRVFLQNEIKMGGGIEGNMDEHLQQFDSRPPSSPEEQAQAIKDAQTPIPKMVEKIAPPLPKGYVTSLEDNAHALTTNAQADDDLLKKVIDKTAPRLKPAPEDGSFATLDAKFAAHMTNPETVPLTPREQREFDETIAALAKTRDRLVKQTESYLSEAADADITGGANPLPFLSKKGLADIQKMNAPNSAIATVASQVARLSAVVRYKEFTDKVKNDPVFQANSVKAELGKNGEPFVPPKGYKKINALPFRDMYVDPKIADPINDFLKGGPGVGNDIKGLTTVNKLAVSALFSLDIGGLLGHGRNLTETLAAARGFDNLTKNPKFARAIQEVWNLGPEYIAVKRAGGSLLSDAIKSDSLITYTMKAMGQSIAKDENRWGGFVKALGMNGVADFAHWWQQSISHELYRFGDVLYMQRYLELRDKGYTVDQARKETELFMPTYRMPSRVLGMRWPAQILGSMNITQFGRYEIAKYTAVANGFRTLFDPKASVEGRKAAVGRLMVTFMMMTAGQYMMNSLVQNITGNPDAEFLWGGPLGLVQKGANAILSPSQDNFNKLIKTMFTMAPGTSELIQQMAGKDSFTGKDITVSGTPANQQAAERVNHAIKGMNLAPPFSLAANLPAYAQDPMSSLTDFGDYVGKNLGVSSPSAGSMFFRNGGKTRTQAREAAIQSAKDPAWVQFLSHP